MMAGVIKGFLHYLASNLPLTKCVDRTWVKSNTGKSTKISIKIPHTYTHTQARRVNQELRSLSVCSLPKVNTTKDSSHHFGTSPARKKSSTAHRPSIINEEDTSDASNGGECVSSYSLL